MMNVDFPCEAQQTKKRGLRAPWLQCAAVAVLQVSAAGAFAQSIVLNADEERVFRKFNWLPYAFFSESFGLGFGVGGGYVGWPQEQASILGAVTLGTKGSYNVVGGTSDVIIPGTNRLVLDPLFSSGRYQEQRVYAGRREAFPGERAGSNDSDQDNYAEVTQWDNWVEFRFRYLLPWGHGRDTIISKYILENGLLLDGASGGDAWNPFTSGRSYLVLTPAWREQTAEKDDLRVPFETLNVELALEYENYDFPFNPSRGSSQRIAYTQDFDDNAVFGEWELWTIEVDKVFNLGVSDRFRQRALALGFWTAYVPTWETTVISGQEVVTSRPPHFEGATLGGLRRMRAYEDDRFQDKAAIYYSAEFRMIPTWQPLTEASRLKWLEIGWWQWVTYAEIGQVAPSWNLSALHDDLHWDAGIGVRGMIHKAVCRLDFTYGEEGGRVVAMYGHPF